ncbi:MAG: CHAT domain-containing protein [Isosphaeraceae bacterium]
MSADDASRFQDLRQLLDRLHRETMSAFGAILSDPDGAGRSLLDLEERADADLAPFQDLIARYPPIGPNLVRPVRLAILQGIGRWATLQGRYDDAIRSIDEALRQLAQDGGPEAGAERASWLDLRGDLERRQGRFDEARTAFDEAHRLHLEAAQWGPAILALSTRASCDLSRDDGDGFLSGMEEAIRLAERHGLAQRAGLLRRDLLRFRIETDPTGEVLEGALKLRQQGKLREALGLDDGQLAQVVAEIRQARQDPGAAREHRKALEKLRQAVADDPDDIPAWNRLSLALKQQAEGLEDDQPTLAMDIMSEAMAIADERVRIPEVIATVLGGYVRICERLGDEEGRSRAIERLRTFGARDVLFQSGMDRAFVRLRRGEPEAAREAIEEVGDLADTPDDRRLFSMTRIVVHQQLPGGEPTALELSRQAIAEDGPFHPDALRGGAGAASRWSTQLGTSQGIHGNAAVLLGRAGRFGEAYVAAEQVRALRLRTRMADAGWIDDPASMINRDALLGMLRGGASAMVLFWVGRERTLALAIDPLEQGDPPCTVIDLGQAELRSWAPAEAGNGWSVGAIEALGGRLAPTLRDVARRVGERGGVLYLAPDSGLFSAPFAALPLGDGLVMADLAATAVVPGATVWASLRDRRKAELPSNRAVASAGEAAGPGGGVIRFRDQAGAVARRVGARWVLEETTGAELLEAAAGTDLLHLEFHGLVEPTASGTLSASALRCARDEPLTADAIADRLAGKMPSAFVFLNACMSGRFRGRLGGEVGGLWEALLLAGATSIVATLHEVDPGSASDLALAFYEGWLHVGLGRAEALRRAQLEVRRTRPDPARWAAHLLIGDGA